MQIRSRVMALLWLLGLSSGHSPDWALIVAVVSTLICFGVAGLYILSSRTP